MLDPKFAIRSLLLAAIAAPFAASCSAPPADEARDDDPATVAQPLAAPDPVLCPVTSTALVLAPSTSPEASCDPVDGRGGTWSLAAGEHPLTCTATVPTASDAVLCVYAWTPRAQQAPDLAALEALPDVYVTSIGEGSVDACTREAMLRFASIVDQAQVKCPGRDGNPNGPKGCDVCGTKLTPGVMKNRLVIPQSSPVRTFVVPMTNGSKQVVTLAADSSAARRASPWGPFLDVPLPKPPRGVRYVPGPVLGYGDDPKH